MPIIDFRLRDDTVRSVASKHGDNVMHLAVNNNIPGIDAECGGSLSCATCHVYVERMFFGAASPEEDELLESVSNRSVESRLSCQLSVPALEAGSHLIIRVPHS